MLCPLLIPLGYHLGANPIKFSNLDIVRHLSLFDSQLQKIKRTIRQKPKRRVLQKDPTNSFKLKSESKIKNTSSNLTKSTLLSSYRGVGWKLL